MEYTNGDFLEGRFIYQKREGYFIYTYKDGSTLSGNYSNDKKNGNFIYYSMSTKIKTKEKLVNGIKYN